MQCWLKYGWMVPEYDTAADYYRKGLAIREQVLGPDHLEVGLNLLTLGMLEVELHIQVGDGVGEGDVAHRLQRTG